MSVIRPIATIYTVFPEKFGVPRQSCLTSAPAKIIFEPKFRNSQALKGIENYDYIWLIWEFTQTKNDDWSPTVRPPRLGGNLRMGVFATRSPFRPNRLGLSSVKLENIELTEKFGPVLTVRGADLVSGTPIFDIKPYLSFTDAHPDAKDGFAGNVKDDILNVVFSNGLENMLTDNKIALLKEILSADPRPHYHNDSKRIYSFEVADLHISFRVDSQNLIITDIKEIGENNNEI